MPKTILLFGTLSKAHVDTFTRKDGSVVQAHDTKVQAKPKLDAKHVRFVEDQLSNNEDSSDEELHAHFVKEGIHPEVAKQALKHRDAFASSMKTPDHIKKMAGL